MAALRASPTDPKACCSVLIACVPCPCRPWTCPTSYRIPSCYLLPSTCQDSRQQRADRPATLRLCADLGPPEPVVWPRSHGSSSYRVRSSLDVGEDVGEACRARSLVLLEEILARLA